MKGSRSGGGGEKKAVKDAAPAPRSTEKPARSTTGAAKTSTQSEQRKQKTSSSVSPEQSHKAAEKWSRDVRKKADRNATNPPKTKTTPNARPTRTAPKPSTTPNTRPTRTVPNTKPTPGRAAPSYGMTSSSVGIGTSPSFGIGTSPSFGIGNASLPISGPNFPLR
jgi:hypothetical protein